MTKEALKLALEALVNTDSEPSSKSWKREIEAIIAIKEALANEALEKMAENARELGLDYEPAQEPCCYGGIAHDCHAGEGCRIVKRMKAAQPEQEPVAWSHAGAMPPEQEVMKEAAYNLAPWLSAALDDPKVCKEYKDVINAWFDAAMPAPQRTWIGLTDAEVKKIVGSDRYTDLLKEVVQIVEAKLRSKNNG